MDERVAAESSSRDAAQLSKLKETLTAVTYSLSDKAWTGLREHMDIV